MKKSSSKIWNAEQSMDGIGNGREGMARMEQDSELSRFTAAHQKDYQRALAEIQKGRKVGHWMWYIFPQIRGLGRSAASSFYAIRSIDEARAFLRDPYLGNHLRKICEALIALNGHDPTAVFGRPDDMKLKSSMTLFARVTDDNQVFLSVLKQYFGGRQDPLTLKILNALEGEREND